MRDRLPERLSAIILALLLTLSGCSPRVGSPPPAPDTDQLTRSADLDGSAIRQIAELIRLEDRREYNPITLDEGLGAAYPEIRRIAAAAAGRIGDRRVIPSLLTALVDTDPGVRAEALFSLGQLTDSTSPAVSRITAIGLDPGEDPIVRGEAIHALGKIGGPEAKTTIHSILVSSNRSAPPEISPPQSLIGEALLASWKLSETRELLDPIIDLAGHEDPEIRWRAAYALMRIGGPDAIQDLLALTADSIPLIRALAVRGLQPLPLDSADARVDAVEVLSRATHDPHPHVRINALRTLANLGEASTLPTIERGLEDFDQNVVLTTIEALSELGEIAADLLEGIAGDSAHPIAARTAALTGLLRGSPERAYPITERLEDDSDWLNRLYLARALAAATEDRGIQILIRLASDPDHRIAATALRGLASAANSPDPNLRRLFIQHLGSADIGVRAAALRGLARSPDPGDLPVILDAYERAQHDIENDALRAAVAALGQLARAGVPVANSFFQRFEESPDLVIRREVRGALGTGSWGEIYPIDTGRDLSFYESIARNLVTPAISGKLRVYADIQTVGGTITIELIPSSAPLTVYNFITLAEQGYYDGFRWHRVVPNFVLQDGDPRGDGLGGPGYSIRDEINRTRYLRGTVGMALDGADTGGSQFFITHAPQPHLDGAYTTFGQVVAGIEIADRINQDDPIQRITVEYRDSELPPPTVGTQLGGTDYRR